MDPFKIFLCGKTITLKQKYLKTFHLTLTMQVEYYSEK